MLLKIFMFTIKGFHKQERAVLRYARGPRKFIRCSRQEYLSSMCRTCHSYSCGSFSNHCLTMQSFCAFTGMRSCLRRYFQANSLAEWLNGSKETLSIAPLKVGLCLYISRSVAPTSPCDVRKELRNFQLPVIRLKRTSHCWATRTRRAVLTRQYDSHSRIP